ncbi:hypothetical protein [Cupriavidus basilensis]|uniref:hypothetical protein n=1 Tax=Cupriavidus basilensis TaxID=68895 RepID=UPI00157B1762|nr:hypothetical protein [Cupriavidus basilensis]NUA27298.1 hypothetical protein [Cupriavidus basilensis]
MPSVSFSIRFLFACCLLVATANHVRADFQHGFLWDYGYGNGAYWASRVFWGALTIVDPLAALLLFIKPRVGIALTAAIISVDVVHNTFYVALNRQWLEPFYLSQVAFLLAVLLLSPVAWHRTARRDASSRY